MHEAPSKTVVTMLNGKVQERTIRKILNKSLWKGYRKNITSLE